MVAVFAVVESLAAARISLPLFAEKPLTMFPLYEQLLEIDRTIGSKVAEVLRQSEGGGKAENTRQFFFSALFRNLGVSTNESESTVDLFHVGLGLFDTPGDPEEDGYDWCTPLNCRPFARTGSGGTHFSFVGIDNEVSESSPVVATLPSDLGCSVVVGENLFEFLCLGCLRGFYGIEQINSDLKAYFNCLDFEQTEKDARYGFETNPVKEAILEHLRKQLGLLPWRNVPERLSQ